MSGVSLFPKIVISNYTQKIDWSYEHTLPGVLLKIGLGLKIYQAAIEQFGYISSEYKLSSKQARSIWIEHLMVSDDYYALKTDEYFYVLSKKPKYKQTVIDKVSELKSRHSDEPKFNMSDDLAEIL